MTSQAVIGLGYGDEGKGVVTEYLASKDPANTIVVRFSGGQQAGHKVIKGDVEHIFSNFGAGTLSGCPTYWTQHCTFNPVNLMREFRQLVSKGLNPKIYLDPKCPATTPYDMCIGQEQEKKHGTTGHGIFRTLDRCKKGLKFDALSVFYISPARLDIQLQNLFDYYKIDIDLDAYINAIYDARTLLNQNIFLSREIPAYKNQIFEGAQGLMLDEFIGHMPHCTPTDVTPRNAYRYATLDEVYLVTRAYQTRHGNGPMTNGHLQVKPFNNEKETNVYNQYQGEFRSTVLDIDQLIYAKKEGIDKVVNSYTSVHLVVTCIDQLDTYRATYNGNILEFKDPIQFAKCISQLLNIKGRLYVNDSPQSFLKQVS